MSKFPMSESAELDTLDLKIIQSLQVGPRLPFARVAEVLGVSEQTVARRYRRLRGSGIMRVVAMVNPRRLGQSDWFVRVGCRPGSATRLAEALARRDDVSWVTISAGGSELVCSVRSLTSRQRDDLLQRLPAAGQVLTLTAHEIMYRFAGGIAQDWTGYGGPLDKSQIAALTPPPVPEPDGPVTLTPGDGKLLAALGRDGRASYATLAAETGWTQGVAAGRGSAVLRHRPGHPGDGLRVLGVPVADRRAGPAGGDGRAARRARGGAVRVGDHRRLQPDRRGDLPGHRGA